MYDHMTLDQLYTKWESEQVRFSDLATNVAASAEQIINEIDAELDSADTEEEAFAALGVLQRGLALLNAAVATDSNATATILSKLSKWIQRLKQGLEKIKAKTSAKGFSITFGFPWGVSVSMDW